jgi:hypothetical protein
VDYSSSNTAKDVYLHFTLKFVERFGNLDLLFCAGETSALSSEWPSWVPDWRGEHRFLDTRPDYASSHFCAKAECKYMDDDHPCLQVYGRRAGEVSELYHFDQKENETWVGALARLAKKCVKRDAVELELDRFTHALCSMTTQSGIPLEATRRLRNQVKQYIRYIFEEVKEVSPDSDFSHLQIPLERGIEKDAAELVWECVYFVKLHPRPFLVTKDGYIGTGMRGAQSGDLIYVLLGAMQMMLLRKVSVDNPQTYRLVGICSFLGLNWGEVLLGPLPEGYIVEPCYQQHEGTYRHSFVNTATGAISVRDPRITWDYLKPHPPMSKFEPCKPAAPP